MNEETTTEVALPDLTELAELCGCTEKQTKFAQGLLAGMSQVEAAFHAGYAGERDSVQLRSAGSSAAHASPVLALLALAESRGLGVPNTPGDRDELRRILWSHARSKDKANSIRATVELDRIDREEMAEARDKIADPAAVLSELAEIIPGVALALATEHGFAFELNETQRARFEDARRNIASEWIKENASAAIALAQQGVAA